MTNLLPVFEGSSYRRRRLSPSGSNEPALFGLCGLTGIMRPRRSGGRSRLHQYWAPVRFYGDPMGARKGSSVNPFTASRQYIV